MINVNVVAVCLCVKQHCTGAERRLSSPAGLRPIGCW